MADDADVARAEAYARAAGVTVRPETDPRRLREVAAFVAETWRTPVEPFPAESLTSIAHAGGATLVAYDAEGRLRGATVAVFGPPDTRSAYSLVAAAASPGRGVGLALKHAQRVWARGCGALSLAWTFDPLVARNGRFNLTKLGATAREYAVDFYGPMTDGLNAGDDSDRLTVRWDLRRDTGGPGRGAGDGGGDADEDADGPPPGASAVADGPDGGALLVTRGDSRWCRVPADVTRMRQDDPAQARAWRRAVRDVLATAFDEGYVARHVTRDGWYRLDREVRPGPSAGTEPEGRRSP